MGINWSSGEDSGRAPAHRRRLFLSLPWPISTWRPRSGVADGRVARGILARDDPGAGAGFRGWRSEPRRESGGFGGSRDSRCPRLAVRARTGRSGGHPQHLPAIATALAGIFTGEWLRTHEEPGREAHRVLCVPEVSRRRPGPSSAGSSPSTRTSGPAAMSCSPPVWPCSRSPWSLYFVDMRGRDGWAKPFLIFGTNSILAYVLSGSIAKILSRSGGQAPEERRISLKSWLYDTFFASWIPEYWASLAWASVHVVVILGITWLLYRKQDIHQDLTAAGDGSIGATLDIWRV